MLWLAVIFSALLISEARSAEGSIQLADKDFDQPEVDDGTKCEQPLLLNAVNEGYLDEIKKRLEGGDDIHALDCFGKSAMHLAVLKRRTDIVLALLEKNFDLNRVFEGVETVLEYTIKKSFELVPFIIGLGANFKQIFEPNGDTYLHRAIRNGDFPFTKKLVELGADLEANDWEYNSPLMLSVKENQIAIFNFLAASGADTSRGDPIHLAVKKNLTDMLRTMLGRGLDVNRLGDDHLMPIALAVRDDNIEIAEILADFKAKLDQPLYSKTLIDLAFANRSDKMIKWLLKRGLKVNEKDAKRLLEASIERDDVDAIESSIAFVKNVTSWDLNGNTTGEPFLRTAIAKGSNKALKFLLERGLKIGNDTKWLTELAIRVDNLEALKTLKEFGVNLNMSSDNDGTLMHYAAMRGCVSCIRWLAEQGLDINSRNEFGQTPLHLAVTHQHLPAVRALVELGSCLECKDNDKMTPLEFAVISHYKYIANYLKNPTSSG